MILILRTAQNIYKSFLQGNLYSRAEYRQAQQLSDVSIDKHQCRVHDQPKPKSPMFHLDEHQGGVHDLHDGDAGEDEGQLDEALPPVLLLHQLWEELHQGDVQEPRKGITSLPARI